MSLLEPYLLDSDTEEGEDEALLYNDVETFEETIKRDSVVFVESLACVGKRPEAEIRQLYAESQVFIGAEEQTLENASVSKLVDLLRRRLVDAHCSQLTSNRHDLLTIVTSLAAFEGVEPENVQDLGAKEIQLNIKDTLLDTVDCMGIEEQRARESVVAAPTEPQVNGTKEKGPLVVGASDSTPEDIAPPASSKAETACGSVLFQKLSDVQVGSTKVSVGDFVRVSKPERTVALVLGLWDSGQGSEHLLKVRKYLQPSIRSDEIVPSHIIEDGISISDCEGVVKVMTLDAYDDFLLETDLLEDGTAYYCKKIPSKDEIETDTLENGQLASPQGVTPTKKRPLKEEESKIGVKVPKIENGVCKKLDDDFGDDVIDLTDDTAIVRSLSSVKREVKPESGRKPCAGCLRTTYLRPLDSDGLCMRCVALGRTAASRRELPSWMQGADKAAEAPRSQADMASMLHNVLADVQYLGTQTVEPTPPSWSIPLPSGSSSTPGMSSKVRRDFNVDLAAIVEAQQKDETAEMDPPENVTTDLFRHQRMSLKWMIDRESGNMPLGGILADEQGLGKTIQALALIAAVSRPPPRASLAAEMGQLDVAECESRRTLVVVPLSLVRQWKAEAEMAVPTLSVMIYHGPNRCRDLRQLRRADIVITTYSVVGSEFPKDDKKKDFLNPVEKGPLLQVPWFRVILDEAHSIKNRRSRSAKGCFALKAERRWCLTGTPVQNGLDDLFALFHFMRYKPYNDYTHFRSNIAQPVNQGCHHSQRRLQSLLQTILLRRTKKSTIGGKPIIELPPKVETTKAEEFSVEERDFYQSVEAGARLAFGEYVRKGTVMKNYTNVLVLLMRLRQACNHPHLVAKAVLADQEQANEKVVESVLDETTKERLLVESNSGECPICMDLLEDPVLTSCNHLFCRHCIMTCLTQTSVEADKGSCPLCRRETPVSSLRAAKSVLEPDVESAGESSKDIDPMSDTGMPPLSTKISKLLEEIREDPTRKMIVFSQWTRMLNLVERTLIAERIVFVRVDGTMSLEKRDEALTAFRNRPDITVILMSLKVGSLGLNLTQAKHVVILDPWWNPSVEAQAVDRVHRIGQTQQVTVTRLTIKDSVEERILKLQDAKRDLAEVALGEEGRTAAKRLSLQDLMQLFQYDQRGAGVPGAVGFPGGGGGAPVLAPDADMEM